MVYNLQRNADQRTNNITTIQGSSDTSTRDELNTPITSKVEIDGWDCIREKYQKQGCDPKTIDVLLASWREGTKKCYSKYLKLWTTHCLNSHIDLFKPPIHQALTFLQKLNEQGYNYGQINTACSALSAIINSDKNVSFGQLLITKRFMKGIYQTKPNFPKYTLVWDVNKVFEYFRKLEPVETLNLKL